MKKLSLVLVLAVLIGGTGSLATAAAPVGAVPVQLKGQLEVLFAEDFFRGEVRKVYRLKEHRTGEVYQIEPQAGLAATLTTGATVVVKGKAKGRTVYLEANGDASLTTLAESVPAVSGAQKTVVIVANFEDAGVACTTADLESRIFTDPLDRSVDDLYRETSFDNLWLEGGVFGPFTIPFTTTSTCDIDAWASAAEAAAAAAGVDVAAYSRKVYILPAANPCGYTGIGTVGGWPSRSWVFSCELTDGIAHELGHNFGMGHSSTPTNTYGDTSDIMGYSGGPLRQINAPHQRQTGWLAPSQYLPVSVGGTYTIAPLELRPTETALPQVLVMAKPDTGETYFLSYRQPIGFDANLSPIYLGGAAVHRHVSGSAAQTYLLARLTDGAVFADAVNGITVTQVAHDGQSVTLEIQLASGPVCTPSSPVVTLSPASQSGMSGEARTYALSVSNPDSPECAATDYALSAVVPYGWAGAVSPTALTLVPGGAGSAFLTVTPKTAATGDFMVAATAAEAGGSRTASGTAVYIVLGDIVAPTAPRSLQAKVGRGVISLTWLAASDNIAVAGYQVWRNGVALQKTTATTFADRTVVGGTTYTYAVTAFDAAGNSSASSNTATATAAKSSTRR